jgi:hypothetical protein
MEAVRYRGLQLVMVEAVLQIQVELTAVII